MRKVRIFRQHTAETCGVCCLMMVLDAFGVEYPTRGKELRLYGMYRSRAAAGTSCASIALALSNRRLDVALVHSSPELMGNRGGYHAPEVYEALLAEYHSAIRRAAGGVDVRAGVNIDCDSLRAELDRGRLVILQVLVDSPGGPVLHGILLHGYEGSDFLVCDPASKQREPWTEQEIDSAMRTPEGIIYISVGEKQ